MDKQYTTRELELAFVLVREQLVVAVKMERHEGYPIWQILSRISERT